VSTKYSRSFVIALTNPREVLSSAPTRKTQPFLPASITSPSASRTSRRDRRYRSIGFDVDPRGIAATTAITSSSCARRRPAGYRPRERRLAADSKRAGARKRRLHRARREKQRPAAGPASNGVLRIERVYIASRTSRGPPLCTPPARRTAAKLERGTVIHADMAIFQFGPTASASRNLTVRASPPTPRRARDRSRSVRTSSMDAAAKWMATAASRRRRAESATPANTRCSSRRNTRAGVYRFVGRRSADPHGFLAGPLRSRLTQRAGARST